MTRMKQISNAPERLVERTAYFVNRRRLLRDASGVAAGATIAGALLDRVILKDGLVEEAYAVTCQGYDCGAQCKTGACGPRPPCNGNNCLDNGQCKDTGGVKASGYGGDVCISPPANKANCWCTCGDGNNLRRCCDCCQNLASGGERCFQCGGGTWHKCLCTTILCYGCC